VVAGLDLPMVLVPPGEFDMGADHLPDARPVHTVAVEAFYLGKWEETQAQMEGGSWAPTRASTRAGAFADAGGKMPVENVFLGRLSGIPQAL